jgi:hypothetical protein
MTSELLIRINQSGIVRVEVDGRQVGLIQAMELRVSSSQPLPELTVKFPEGANNPATNEMIEKHVETMQQLPYCKVTRR